MTVEKRIEMFDEIITNKEAFEFLNTLWKANGDWKFDDMLKAVYDKYFGQSK